MRQRNLVVGVLLVLGLLLRPGHAESTATLSVGAIDFGNFRSDGYHLATDPNYMAGRSDDTGRSDRTFFLFDLSTIGGKVVSAELQAWNPSNGFYSPNPSETLTLYDVSSTTLPKLRTSWNDGTDVFADLGSGQTYGSLAVTNAHNNNTVKTPLNSTGVAAMNGVLEPGQPSQLFAIGGAITTFAPLYQDAEFVFANTNDAPPFSPQLVVTFQTPEPGMAVHLGTLGLLGLVVGWRRWRAAKVRWRRGR